MACKIDETVKLIDNLIESEKEYFNDYKDDIVKLKDAKEKLNSFKLLKSNSQINTTGSESIDSTKKDFRSEFKNKRPSADKWVDKEVAKFDVATQAISDGTNNSTAGFVKDFYGDKANTGTYTKDDVVYLSTNGNRAGRVVPVKNGVLQGAYKNIDKAIEAGAKFVADTSKHLSSTGKYNVGEVELAEYLQSKGYAREDKDGYGLWSPSKLESQVENKPLEPEIKYGSVVKYKPENGTEGYYIVRGFSANGGLQLTDSSGKNFSGTPNVNKVKFAKQLEIKRYNNVDYIIDSNNRAYTKNGKVADSYVNQIIGKNKIENESNKDKNKTEIIDNKNLDKKISEIFNNKLYGDIVYDFEKGNKDSAVEKIIRIYSSIETDTDENTDLKMKVNDRVRLVNGMISALNDYNKLSRKMIDDLFGKNTERNYEIQPGIVASEGQKNLIDTGIKFLEDKKNAEKIGENIMIVQGRGGTGKTSSISRVLINYINENNFISKPNIYMMTLSHQAKDVLYGMSKQISKETGIAPITEVIAGSMAWYANSDQRTPGSKIEQRTVSFGDKKISYENKDAKREGKMSSSVSSSSRGDIIVVDEASMLDSHELGYLLEKTKQGVKIILMGDYHQAKIVSPNSNNLIGFGEKSEYSKVFDHFTGSKDPLLTNATISELTEIHRQKEGSNILDFADYYADVIDSRIGNKKEKPIKPKANEKDVSYINKNDVVSGIVDDINNGKDAIYIAHTNKDVTVTNNEIRKVVSKDPESEYSVGDRMISYANYSTPGEPPIITNSERLIVVNVENATSKEISNEKVKQSNGNRTYDFKYRTEDASGKKILYKKLTLERKSDSSDSEYIKVIVPDGLLRKVIKAFENQATGSFDAKYKDLLTSYIYADGYQYGPNKDTLNFFSAGSGLSYGYAITAHKSQGSTVDIVYTTLPSDPNLSYVAITRAREKVNIVGKEDSQSYNPQSEPDGIDSILNSGIDEKVRDIKISDKDLEIIKKENEELTKKTGVSIKWINNDANADFNYNPDDNSVTYVEGFNDTITTVLQNHELKHALTFQYLKKNENDNKVKELIKGVNDFKDRLTELRARESKNAKKDNSESYISKTNDLYERVAYMLENSSDSKISNELRQVAEIVAILSAEKDIREQFLNEFKGDKKSKIKILIYWIKSKLNFSEVKAEYVFSPRDIVKTVDKIVKQSSKEYKKNKEYAELSEPEVVDNKYDADDDLSIKIKEKLSSTYKGIDFSKLNIESSSAVIDYIGNKSIDTIPHEYASVYIDILRDTVFVDAAIKNIAKYRNMSIENAEKLLIENMGKNYIEYIKNGTGDKHIMGIVDKIWSKILDFFGKFDNTINEINIISERFYNGVNSDAMSYSPKKGFEKVDTEATFIDQPFAGNVLKTVIETNPDLISFTGSASLALQEDIYRKGKNGITDLHDLDFIVKGENALDSARDKMFKNFSATEIYNFGLSSGRTERISTLIVVPKEYKIPYKSIKRSNKLRVTSYEIIDSYGKTIGTYNADLDSSGQIISENTTGFKAVIVDLMQEGNSEKSGIKYYSNALNTEITLADPESVFSAKNDIGKDIPRDKDVRDSVSFYGRNKYKTISKDDIEAAKDIMSNNKKECE